jgi:hypothetical protein
MRIVTSLDDAWGVCHVWQDVWLGAAPVSTAPRTVRILAPTGDNPMGLRRGTRCSLIGRHARQWLWEDNRQQRCAERFSVSCGGSERLECGSQ